MPPVDGVGSSSPVDADPTPHVRECYAQVRDLTDGAPVQKLPSAT